MMKGGGQVTVGTEICIGVFLFIDVMFGLKRFISVSFFDGYML